MKLAYLALVVAVELGGAFGSASATVESLEDTVMLVDIEVEVRVSAQAVVAHLGFEDDPTLTLPLLDRGDGVFGIRTELETKNYIVVFDAVGAEDGLSQPVSLVELGADLSPDVPGVPPTTEGDDGLSSGARQLGWLALALGAASLSALAFWVLGGRDKSADTDGSAEEE
ncbi:MAG: hypothetical protein V3U46_09090 [Acidimicrobiia bacterium]